MSCLIWAGGSAIGVTQDATGSKVNKSIPLACFFVFFPPSPGAVAAAQILQLKFPVATVTASLDIDTQTN